MSDEQASSPSSAFCAESVATLDTVRKPPAARINLCAFPAVPQGKRHEMVNQTVLCQLGPGRILRHPQTPEGPPWFWTITARSQPFTITDTQLVANRR